MELVEGLEGLEGVLAQLVEEELVQEEQQGKKREQEHMY